jgi:hypothetical protein
VEHQKKAPKPETGSGAYGWQSMGLCTTSGPVTWTGKIKSPEVMKRRVHMLSIVGFENESIRKIRLWLYETLV